MFSIIVSEQDIAGMNMKKIFLDNFPFKYKESNGEFDSNTVYTYKDFELLTIKEFQVYADCLGERKTDFFVFASRHSSKAGTPSLTVHPIGNWGKAELGGRDNELVPTSAILLKNYLLSLQEKKESNSLQYEVSFEVTHHGPLLSKPAVFIELGSSEKQWKDENAALAVCETIIGSSSLKAEPEQKICLAFGGPHYAPEFTKLVLRDNYAVSHMCPQYALPFFTEGLLKKAITGTLETVQQFVIAHKSMGSEKKRNLSILEGQGMPITHVRKLLK